MRRHALALFALLALTVPAVAATRMQAWFAPLDYLGAVTPAADVVPYFTSSTAASTTPLTSTARGLLDDTSTSAMRSTLGVSVGSDVEAWDADLDAVAALSSTGLAARTGSGTWTVRSLTTSGTGVTVTNGDGVSGAPTVSLDSDLQALAATSQRHVYVETITSTGTWNKPSWATTSNVALYECWGPGGPGGSGRKGAAGSARLGGGGGGAGGYARHWGTVADGDGATVTMGALGTPGTAQSANSSNGNAGVAGGTTSWGSIVLAGPGSPGAGGTGASQNARAAAGTPSPFLATNSAGTSTLFGSGFGASATTTGYDRDGGGGFGGQAGGGGAGCAINASDARVTGGGGGGSSAGTAGPAGTSVPDGGTGTAGDDGEGGSGGISSITGNAGAGGAGGAFGGGGGGGGASVDATGNSGAGGASGAPACRITIWPTAWQ